VSAYKGKVKGIFHCFSGTAEEAQRIISLGEFKMGIGGVLTYKNAPLPAVLKNIDLDQLVLETDSPYLPPVPYRGKRNESAYVKLMAEKLAEVRNCSVEEVADITKKKLSKFFGT
jgi:TatD DNase family protein